MMKLRLVLVALLATAIPAHAQRPGSAPAGDRPALEQQFRERATKLAKERLGLTDAQLQKLQQSNARFAPQLRQLTAQERDIRTQLRQEMTVGNAANQQHVSELLDASLRLQ